MSHQGRPARDPNFLTAAQLRKIESKRLYDQRRYEKISNHAKWGSTGHRVKITKRGLAKRRAPGQAALSRLIGHYRWNSKIKCVAFELTREQFFKITQLQCHYCNAVPSSVCGTSDLWSWLTYNGVDRRDNSKGYTLENCVPCCKICNLAKRDLSESDFLSWVARVYTHQQRQS